MHDQALFSPELELHTLELPKLPPRSAGHRDPKVVDWGRLLAAQTEQELKELAMTDPIFEKAKNAREVVSADPEAQELARRRQLALWETRRQEALAREEGRAAGQAEGRAAGEQAGESRGLHQAMTAVCEVLGLEVDAQHQAEIDSLDAERLERLLTSLRQNRSWPNE